MKLDEILREVGEFGLYQKRLYFLLSLPAMSVGCFMVMVVIVLYTPEHRCKIPLLDNDTFEVQDEVHQMYINQTIPAEQVDGNIIYQRCFSYSGQDGAKYDVISNKPINSSSFEKCQEWVYDKSVFKTTFTSQIDLVCDDGLKIPHIQMLCYFGVLVGDIILGNTGDLFGRKIALYISLIGQLAVTVGVTFAPEFYSFAILQFIAGGMVHGSFLTIAVIGLEIVGPAKRVWTGMFIQMFFAFGEMYLILVAFLIRDWKWINLACALPCAFYLTYWWFVPESPRWLISKGKLEESRRIMEKIAKVNKKTIPPHLLETTEKERIEEKDPDAKLWHILGRPVLLKRTLILMFNWMIVSMTYYGVIMNSGNLAGNFYFNFFLMALAEIPGLLIGIFILDKIGRRYANSGSMCLGGFACICTIFTVVYGGKELQPLTIVLAFIGKAGASAAFGIVYIFTAELLPTVVRNAALGSCSCAARVGSMLAPYIAKSGELIGGKFGKAEPLLVFGVLSVVAGLMLLLLPETYGRKLPDTMKEGEEFGRKSDVPEQEIVVEAVPFMKEERV